MQNSFFWIKLKKKIFIGIILAFFLLNSIIYGNKILKTIHQDCSVGLFKMMNCSHPDKFYFDEKYVPILEQFSKQIPQDEKVLVFNEAPYYKFFLDRYALLNWSMTNKDFMPFINKSEYKYIVLAENNGATNALKNITSTKNLANLRKDFDILDNQSSRTRKLYLLRLKNG